MADAWPASHGGSGTRGDPRFLLGVAWSPALWRAAASSNPSARVAIVRSRPVTSPGRSGPGAPSGPQQTHTPAAGGQPMMMMRQTWGTRYPHTRDACARASTQTRASTAAPGLQGRWLARNGHEPEGALPSVEGRRSTTDRPTSTARPRRRWTPPGSDGVALGHTPRIAARSSMRSLRGRVTQGRTLS